MIEEKIDIDDFVLHKTLKCKQKFSSIFFNNFIEDDDNDYLFLSTIINALNELSSITLKEQGLSIKSIDGEVIRYDVNVLVSPKLIDFVTNNLSDKYYQSLVIRIVPNYFIIENNTIPDDIIYLIENNNCVNINIEL